MYRDLIVMLTVTGKEQANKEWCCNPAYLFKRKKKIKSLHMPFTKLKRYQIFKCGWQNFKSFEYYIKEYP